MAGWFLSTLCTTFVAFGFATIVTTRAYPDTVRAVVADVTDWSGRTYQTLVREPATPQPEPMRFITAAIQRGSLEQVVTATGALQPVDTVEVGSQLPGQIARLHVDFNDRVRKGDPLAEIDQRSFVAKVDQERAALEVARANLVVQQARLDRARIDLDNAQANRTVLRARQDNAEVLEAAARRHVERKTILRSHEVASLTSVEDAQTELATRNAQVRETTSLLDQNVFLVDAAAADVRRLEGELAEAKAAIPMREASLRSAEIELDRTTIRSPIDGVIVGRFVNEGQTLAAGLEARTAFNVARNLAEMEIHARIDETDIGRVNPGQRAGFSVDAYPGRRFDAVVRQVRKASQTNQGVVTYTVVLKTDNRDGLLLPGMTALTRLTVEREEDVLRVPLAALRFRPAVLKPEASKPPASGSSRDQAVWVQDPAGAIRLVSVTTGIFSADLVALKDGALSEGDRVVVGQADPPEQTRFLGIRLGL